MTLPARLLVMVGLASAVPTLLLAQSPATVAQSGVSRRPAEPCSVRALQRQVPSIPAGSNDSLQNLVLQTAKWQVRQPMSYRLCVVTLNPLINTVTETDVVQGRIRVARQAENIPGFRERLNDKDWAPSEGNTVEMLFEMLRQAFTRMDAPSTDAQRLVAAAIYEQTFGYPVHIYITDGGEDGNVRTLIRLTPSPAAPLTPVSPGEVYRSPRRGRIVDLDGLYSTLLGFGFPEIDVRIRTLWPALADAILEHGNEIYWKRFQWAPQAGMEGTILGTFKHPSGLSIYLMAFAHNNQTLYVPIEMESVALSR